ncbi:hypothetical protein RQP46_005415 [Phenoliferia psychrophenolica]
MSKQQYEPSFQQEVPPLPNYAVAAPTTFACVTLNMSDRLRLIRFSDGEINALRTTIEGLWPRIQSERVYHGAHEFKLKGYPWSGQGREAIPARRLMCGILSTLHQRGWVLTLSTDVTKKGFDKDSLVFRFNTTPPPPSYFCAISFNEGDKLRLIGGTRELQDAIEQKEPDTHEINSKWKMLGYPWFANGDATVTTRCLILDILSMLERHGWSLYASVDQSTGGGDQGSSDTDSWYLRRRQDWQPGMPVY